MKPTEKKVVPGVERVRPCQMIALELDAAILEVRSIPHLLLREQGNSPPHIFFV
jgi:hypothetical protein